MMCCERKDKSCRTASKPTCTPDVVVLEHDHAAQVVAVHVNAANEHSILFDDAETWILADGH